MNAAPKMQHQKYSTKSGQENVTQQFLDQQTLATTCKACGRSLTGAHFC
jgi:hypothetical protein